MQRGMEKKGDRGMMVVGKLDGRLGSQGYIGCGVVLSARCYGIQGRRVAFGYLALVIAVVWDFQDIHSTQ